MSTTNEDDGEVFDADENKSSDGCVWNQHSIAKDFDEAIPIVQVWS